MNGLISRKDALFDSPSNAKIRVHGNGFIQAETVAGNKIHIWHKSVPRQKYYTPLHNHNHGFTSHILYGQLRLDEFEIAQSRWSTPHTYQTYVAKDRYEKDTELVLTNDESHYHLINKRHYVLTPGSSYVHPANIHLYHQVSYDSDWLLTYVERGTLIENVQPYVLVPSGFSPDNDFNRYGHFTIACKIYHEAKLMLSKLNIRVVKT